MIQSAFIITGLLLLKRNATSDVAEKKKNLSKTVIGTGGLITRAAEWNLGGGT